MDLKDAVLARVDLAELIGQYVSLHRSGRGFVGRCPFHEEKTPSFSVAPEKGFFHCFGCKASGDAITFVMRIENLEFRDALEWLARRYNLDPAEYQQRGQASSAGPKERLYKLNETVAHFYREQLRSPAGEEARRYLEKRGVGLRLIEEFDLGYAPRQWQALTDLLLGQGAKSAELVSLGLIKPRSGENAGGGQGGHYDAFRHRLIFPIRSVTGRVIGFAGRALSAEDNPKYLNVSNTPLYDKSAVLYNLDRAKGSLRDEGAVVVEGYMDVIGLAGVGVQNAVASCGTALTADHVKLLARYTERFYLAFDGDEAGRRAAWSGGVLFLRSGLDARVVALPSGVDPDELALNQGIGAWQELLKQAGSVVRFWLEHQSAAHPSPDMALMRKWVSQLKPLYSQLPDAITRQQMKQEVASVLRMGAMDVESLLRGESKAAPSPGSLNPRAALKHQAAQQALMQGSMPLEREVLRRLAQDEEFRFTYGVQGRLEPKVDAAEWFADSQLREAYEALMAAENGDVVIHDVRFAALFAALLAEEPLQDDNEQLLRRHRNIYLDRCVEVLQAEYLNAERGGDSAMQTALLNKILQLKALYSRVQGLGNRA